MFDTIGVPELLIILAVVVLLFGAGKVSRLGKDLGTSVKEFRRAMKDEDEATPVPNGEVIEGTVNEPYVAPQYAQVQAPQANPATPPAEPAPPRPAGPQVF
jgi:sec-independent protein translocase protein TatA